MTIRIPTSSQHGYLKTSRQKVNKMDRTKTEQSLSVLLEGMDIPNMRRDVTNTSNLRWLMRNLMARNSEHPNVSAVRALIRDLLRTSNNS